MEIYSISLLGCLWDGWLGVQNEVPKSVRNVTLTYENFTSTLVLGTVVAYSFTFRVVATNLEEL